MGEEEKEGGAGVRAKPGNRIIPQNKVSSEGKMGVRPAVAFRACPFGSAKGTRLGFRSLPRSLGWFFRMTIGGRPVFLERSLFAVQWCKERGLALVKDSINDPHIASLINRAAVDFYPSVGLEGKPLCPHDELSWNSTRTQKTGGNHGTLQTQRAPGITGAGVVDCGADAIDKVGPSRCSCDGPAGDDVMQTREIPAQAAQVECQQSEKRFRKQQFHDLTLS